MVKKVFHKVMKSFLNSIQLIDDCYLNFKLLVLSVICDMGFNISVQYQIDSVKGKFFEISDSFLLPFRPKFCSKNCSISMTRWFLPRSRSEYSSLKKNRSMDSNVWFLIFFWFMLSKNILSKENDNLKLNTLAGRVDFS